VGRRAFASVPEREKGCGQGRNSAEEHGNAWGMDEYATRRMSMHERLAHGSAGRGYVPVRRRERAGVSEARMSIITQPFPRVQRVQIDFSANTGPGRGGPRAATGAVGGAGVQSVHAAR